MNRTTKYLPNFLFYSLLLLALGDCNLENIKVVLIYVFVYKYLNMICVYTKTIYTYVYYDLTRFPT